MKRNMFIILLTLSFALAVACVQAFADDSSTDKDFEISTDSTVLSGESGSTAATKTVSEYDMIKALQKYSNSELKAMGCADDEISEIKQPLKAKGKYGKVTYTISYSKMYQKNGETFLKTKMTWDWSSAPIALHTDIPAMTTSENFTKDSATAKVQYYLYGNKNNKSSTASPTVKTKDSGTGVFIKVAMGKNWNKSDHVYKEVALSGSITTSWSLGKKVKSVGISSNYGHSVISVSPSVSFGTGISISFSPAKSCKSGDEAYEKAKLK